MSTYPIEFKQLEEENEQLQAENKQLKGQVYILSKFLGEEEAKDIINGFEKEVQALRKNSIPNDIDPEYEAMKADLT